ncbi:MAG TPA: ABC transporter ATP-binding protein [Candidatus Kapabacteria bacterium]|nr:ABC transporter ATP-binding protein [Candidatus Kapabacteria bacterium]
MDLALASNNIVKTYGTGTKAVHALRGVSLSVAPGEIFGLLGKNGAGKTTFIKCVLGIVFLNGGDGTVLGNPFGSTHAKERLGYLPENHRYPLYLTGEQVLNYFGKLSGVREPLLSRRIEETLKIVGMTEWRKTKVRKYSKGMMQRLGLAQALINDPQLIMLDEPTDGVDPVGRKEIREVLLHLKSEGKTIFLNSHLLSEVERISDRVAIMDHGTIVKEGSVDDLTRTENVYEFRVNNITPDLIASMGNSIIHADGSVLEVRSGTPEDLNRTMDIIRAAGGVIESMTPKKSSLEDVFVDLIKTSEVTHE